MLKHLIKHWTENKILTDKRIIKAFADVPREKFVLPEYKKCAYADEPLPIGFGQTISQPTTIAIMTQALEPKEGQRILEVGTGSGYQAAILSEIVGKKGKVITIERLPALCRYASKNLKKYKNVKVIQGDGSKGYEKEAPFDRIIITAAAAEVPERLFEQLKKNGIMVVPVNDRFLGCQRMLKIRKSRGKKEAEDFGAFVFVPLVEGNTF